MTDEKEINMTLPEIGSLWRHKNGNLYQVYDIQNECSEREEYPIRISYKGVNERKWNRDFSRWHGSMTSVVLPKAPTNLHSTTILCKVGFLGLLIETSYTLHFSVESWGCASNGWDEPGEAPEINIWRLWEGDDEGELKSGQVNVFMASQDLLNELEARVIDEVTQGDHDPEPDIFDDERPTYDD